MENVIRLLIIFISAITIPYLLSLIAVMLRTSEEIPQQKLTRRTLLLLFTIMTIASVLSIAISATALIFNGPLILNQHVGDISRIRTILLTTGNFILALYFYKIHAQ